MTEPQSLDAGTEYVILAKSDDDGIGWVELKPKGGSSITARSAEAAVRAVGEAGTFVAVPVRNWRSFTVVARTETTFHLA